MLEIVKLTDFANRKPHQLSGGQQQRVALARALVIKPDLLLMDESLSALDKNLRLQMQVELRQIQKKFGITAVFVTHDQEEALTMSDKIAVMNNGKIEQLDSPQTIYENPANVFVAGFLGKANFFKGSIIKKNGNNYVHKLENGCIIEFESDKQYSVGYNCTVTIRPEKITVHKKQNEGTSIKGKIQFITYVGNITNYRIELLGQIIEAQEQNRSESYRFNIGDEVYISWNKDNILILQ